jgi:hypothetical protein
MLLAQIDFSLLKAAPSRLWYQPLDGDLQVYYFVEVIGVVGSYTTVPVRGIQVCGRSSIMIVSGPNLFASSRSHSL